MWMRDMSMLGGYSTAQRNQMTALRELKLTLGLL
jgi:hypothetical protein